MIMCIALYAAFHRHSQEIHTSLPARYLILARSSPPAPHLSSQVHAPSVSHVPASSAPALKLYLGIRKAVQAPHRVPIVAAA